MRIGDGAQTEGLYWLLRDHLGSTAVTADSAGNKYSEVRYKAWGETRFTNGNTPTTFRFTGQRQEQSLGGLDGLYYYGARWYDPALGRWIQPDSIVPIEKQGEQAWDRYAYVNNNPVRYIDPTGYLSEDEIIENFGVKTWKEVEDLFEEGGDLENQWGYLEILEKAELGDKITIYNDQGESFVTSVLKDERGKLYLVTEDFYSVDFKDVGLLGKSYELLHNESGIGNRWSKWAVSSTGHDLTWVGSMHDIIGGFGPEPGKPMEPVGKYLIVSLSFLGAAELFHLGVECVGGGIPFVGIGFFGVGSVLVIIGFNTAQAPTYNYSNVRSIIK